MAQRVQLIVTVPENQLGQCLDQTLVEMFPGYSRPRTKERILDQRMLVDGKVYDKPKEKVLGDEQVTISAEIEEKACFGPQNTPLDVAYEDEDIIAISKPRNLVVHPGAGNPDGAILNVLFHHYLPIIDVLRVGIVHRLGRDTTSLMVMVRATPARTRLIESLQWCGITRGYEVVVIGRTIAGGIVGEPVSRHLIKHTHMAMHSMGKPTMAYYRIMEHSRVYTRLRLCLETGRVHQIRVHMAHTTHPLMGDPVHGGHPRPPEGASEVFISTLHKSDRQVLHVAMLRLYHPISGIETEWHAPVPQDMVELIEMTRADLGEHKDKMDWL